MARFYFPSLSSFSLSLSLAFMIFISVSSLNSTVQAKQGAALFVFGDSFYDTGDSNFLATARNHANIPPYGRTFFKKPTGRFSDGRLIPDFIAQYAHLPLPSPYLQPGLTSYRNGVNFACAGAGALNETFPGTVISLKMQVENYKKAMVKLRQQLGHGGAKTTLSKAVYLFNIGTNDYLYPIATNSITLNAQYVNLVVGNITTAIKELYRLGGRKFKINNVGPLGCFPAVRAAVPTTNGTCVQPVLQIVMLHNQLLSQALSELAKEWKDFKYGLFDMYNNLEKMISNPTNYGFKESTTACCGSGPFRGIFSCGGQGNVTNYELCDDSRDYVFWDSIHPSERAYKELATQIWAGSPPDVGPYNVKTLFHA